MRVVPAWIYPVLAVPGIFSVLFFSLGLYCKPRYLQGFEEEEYGRDHPFVAPDAVLDGLALYTVGSGEPLLLFLYPHGHTTEPMAQGPMAGILAGMGRTVVTFDAPGAFRSTREPVGDVAEMIRSADETLDRLGITGPVDVVGHSMGGACRPCLRHRTSRAHAATRAGHQSIRLPCRRPMGIPRQRLSGL